VAREAGQASPESFRGRFLGHPASSFWKEETIEHERAAGYVFSGMVGMARCAVRAARLRRNVWRNSHVARDPFRPLMRGRGHRSAMSLPR